MIIGVSGTPGTGKSTVAAIVAKRLGGVHIDLSRLVLEKGFYVDYDRERGSYVVDEERVRRYLSEEARSRLVVLDSHYAEIAPRELVIRVFVLRLNPLKLLDRLLSRGWPLRKVVENVEAELLGVCTRNAVDELGPDMVVEIDTTGRSAEEVADEIIAVLRGKPVPTGTRIDWTTILRPDELYRLLETIELGYSTPQM